MNNVNDEFHIEAIALAREVSFSEPELADAIDAARLAYQRDPSPDTLDRLARVLNPVSRRFPRAARVLDLATRPEPIGFHDGSPIYAVKIITVELTPEKVIVEYAAHLDPEGDRQRYMRTEIPRDELTGPAAQGFSDELRLEVMLRDFEVFGAGSLIKKQGWSIRLPREPGIYWLAIEHRPGHAEVIVTYVDESGRIARIGREGKFSLPIGARARWQKIPYPSYIDFRPEVG